MVCGSMPLWHTTTVAVGLHPLRLKVTAVACDVMHQRSRVLDVPVLASELGLGVVRGGGTGISNQLRLVATREYDGGARVL